MGEKDTGETDGSEADAVDTEGGIVRRTLRRLARAAHGFHQGHAQVDRLQRKREK